MPRIVTATMAIFLTCSALCAQTPSYSKDIRPFLTKYCLECHNAKTLKGTLSLETHKAMMDGSDSGPVIVAGQPDKSKLVLLTEHKEKPTMPPPKAKFQPTKAEIKQLREWVLAGAKDDAVNVKVELPVIKPKVRGSQPVTALYCSRAPDEVLGIARENTVTHIILSPSNFGDRSRYDTQGKGSVTALAAVQGTIIAQPRFVALSRPGEHGSVRVGFGDNLKGEHPAHTNTILDLVVDKAGRWLASASYDTRIHVKEWQGEKFHILKEHSDAVYGLAFNPDGTLLASVSADRAMKVFDVEKGKLLYTLGEATDWLYTVAWSPDGRYLVSGGVDKSLRVYEALRPLTGTGSPWNSGAKLRQSVFAHEGAVQKVVFTSDSKTLYSVGQDRVVKAWDIEKMAERKVYDKQPETVLCLALREDAGQFIVGRYDGIVQLIDMKSGKVVHEFGQVKEGEKGRKKEGEEKPARNPQASAASLRDQVPAITNIAGTLDRAGAVHVHRIDVKKDQQLGVQLIKAKDSKIEPVLTVTDKAGRIIADSYDGHLGVMFPAEGNYSISVRDREYRGGPDFKYQLKLGEIPIVMSVFPMGMPRGTKGDIHLDGVFLPKKVIPLAVAKDAGFAQMLPLSIGNGVLGKAQIVVGEYPEFIGGGKMSVNSTANGRIEKDNQKDLWSFSAKKGQRLIVEANARRIGSRLDSVIEILHKNDQPVPRAVLRCQAKTNVTFRDHDSAQGGIRIDVWSELATNDLLYVGNELMKIKELPTHPDADCNFFATDGKRLTYLDTTPTHHANNTPMYKVSLHPPGTTFPPNGFPVFTLYYKNDDGGPGYGRDSRLIFDPPADGEYKVRIADARGMGGVNFGYRLTIRPPHEHFTLRATPTAPIVSRGGAVPITITAERIDGFDGPILVKPQLPSGFHMPATTIEAGTYTTTVALFADVDAKLPKRILTLILESSSTQATGLRFPPTLAILDMPKLIEPGDIVTTTAESEVSIKPGQQTKMLVKIERRNGFKGRVPLDVKGLPHGVRVLDIGLNGILVNENETTRTVVLYAEPWVQTQEHPFVVLAKREGKNTEHAAKSVMLKVK
ncbi:MAG: hypothetical protein EXR98_00790 [Gemmataceae bacterium]|nr:hypothetical protein [Gemmataceae bacterium]